MARPSTPEEVGAPGATGARDPEFVQGLERGFAVIGAFSADSPDLNIAEVARRTGLTRAVARRYLLTLCSLGYVAQRDDRFTLTPRLLGLGFTYLSTLDVTSVAQPFMERAAATLHESCSVAVLDATEVVYIARQPAKRIMSINLAVGSRLPAHATSLGKVLLAHLPSADLDRYFESTSLERLTDRTIGGERTLRKHLGEVRARGWAIANEESERGVRSVAAPLVDRNGSVHAALNVSAHASRVSLRQLRSTHLPVVLEAARGISASLGASTRS